jgi:hypothetical protein
VLLGVLTDIGGSLAIGLLFVLVMAFRLAAQGLSPEQIEKAVTEMDPWSAWAMVSYALGCAFSALGGYVCARVARHSELQLAGIVAAIGVVFGWAVGSGPLPFTLNLLLTVLAVLCVMLGAWVGRRQG